MPIHFSKARQFVRFVVKPRPSIRAIRLAGPKVKRRALHYYSRARQPCPSPTPKTLRTMNSSLFASSCSDLEVYNPNATFESNLEPVIEDSVGTSTTTTRTSQRGSTQDALDEHPLLSNDIESNSSKIADTPSPRVLRSYRHRKAKSVSDAERLLCQVKEGMHGMIQTAHTWPGPYYRSISWTLSTGSVSPGSSSSSLFPLRTRAGPILAISVPDASAYTTDCSRYVTAPSVFEDSLDEDSGRVLQAVDRQSGVVFERVCQGGQDRTPWNDILTGYSSDLSYHIVPSAWLPTTGSSYCTDAMGMPGPSMMLTVPTPVAPSSPVFVSQSPITVPKFFSAAEPEEDNEEDRQELRATPSLELCGNCNWAAFEEGSQCRDCNQQWLACKVWYRAHDGGRRRWLTEPYIRPGESNARNRALMHGLGVPGCGFEDGDYDDDEDYDYEYDEQYPRPPTFPRLRRVGRIVYSRARGALIASKYETQTAVRRLFKRTRRNGKRGLERLQRVLAGPGRCQRNEQHPMSPRTPPSVRRAVSRFLKFGTPMGAWMPRRRGWAARAKVRLHLKL